MPKLIVIDKNGDEHTRNVDPGTTLWDACDKAGVSLPHSCGFGGQCSTCVVTVVKGGIGQDKAISPVDSEEVQTMEAFGLDLETQVLSCSVQIFDDATVQQPEG